MGLFKRKQADRDLLTFTLYKHWDELDAWDRVGVEWSGNPFARGFMPATALEAAATTIADEHKESLLESAEAVCNAYGAANDDTPTEFEGVNYREFGDVTAAFFDERSWVNGPSTFESVFSAECELVTGGARTGLIAKFHPWRAATDLALCELFGATWDWLMLSNTSTNAQRRNAAIATGAVAMRLRAALYSGEELGPTSRGKYFPQAISEYSALFQSDLPEGANSPE